MIIYNLILDILFLLLILVYIVIAIFNRRASRTFINRLGINNIKKGAKVGDSCIRRNDRVGIGNDSGAGSSLLRVTPANAGVSKGESRNEKKPFHYLSLRQRPVWFHCSSVGEVNAVKNLVNEIKKVYPDVFITTLTDTGLTKAEEIVGKDRCSIIPFDFNFLIKRFINKLNPRLLIIEETEIWPNIIWQSYLKRIPIVYINALISKKSFTFYKMLRFIFEKILKKIDRFYVQNKETEIYLKQLKVSDDKIAYVGVTKFDIPLFINKRYKRVFEPKAPVLCCGSIRDGEDEILIRVYKRLKEDYHNLKLILAPRHIDRVNRISKLLSYYNLNFEKYSQIKNRVKKDILIVDKMGVLIQMYQNSSVSFIGGTLVPIGGHNPLEPAACGKPIVSGPYTKNNYVAFQMLKENKGLIIVNDEEELYYNVKLLFQDRKKRISMGKKAIETLKKNQGVSVKLKNFIWKNYLKK